MSERWSTERLLYISEHDAKFDPQAVSLARDALAARKERDEARGTMEAVAIHLEGNGDRYSAIRTLRIAARAAAEKKT